MNQSIISRVRSFLREKNIAISLFIMAIISVVIIFSIQLSLNIYTKHGQKTTMIDLQGMSLEQAQEHCQKYDFELIVNDSVYIADTDGETIIRQSPVKGSIVKNGRKVYLTVTKKVAEEISTGLFPDLYGKDYENISVLLDKRYNLRTTVKEYAFDPGPENMVLEAYINDQIIVNRTQQNRDILIPKGSTISFVLSQRAKGPIEIPNLKCLKYSAVDFVLSSNELKLGKVFVDGTVGLDTMNAWVVKQAPDPDLNQIIEIGSTIDIHLSSLKGNDCL